MKHVYCSYLKDSLAVESHIDLRWTYHNNDWSLPAVQPGPT